VSKKVSLIARAAVILWGLSSTQGVRAEPAPEYLEPDSLYAITWGGTYGVSMILTADPSQANALRKLDGAEVDVLGYVFSRQMPNTKATPLALASPANRLPA